MDLTSGYHHVDIFQEYQICLGSSWIFNNIERYFVFTVLPFGLKSSAYIFTKLLRPLVVYWRRQSIKVVLYGFGFAENNELCYEHEQVFKNDIVRSGLVPNEDKGVWKPSQTIEWLGFLWDLKLGILRVPEKRVLELYALISAMLSNFHRVRARTLIKVSGKIIAMTPSVGFITQIMTRCMFSTLNEKLDWNSNLNIYHKRDCIRELMFWKLNISI